MTPALNRGDHQLPPGRHGYSREFVEANQRERILNAVADVAGVAGYGPMSVEDIISVAGVSRRTFYDHYDGKAAAFLALSDQIVAGLLERVGAVYDPSESLALRGERCLRAAMEYFAEKPNVADVCVVQSLAAGPDALAKRDAAVDALAGIIDQAASELPKRGRPPAMTSHAIVGGIYQIIYSAVLHGTVHELPSLVPDMLFGLLLPFVGADEARAAQKAAKGRTKKRSAGEA